MKKLLSKYKDCNVFSLSERYSYLDLASGDYRYYYLNDDEASEVVKKLEDETYSRLKELYKKNKLGYDFDDLYDDIIDECMSANDRFIADCVIKGQTKYKNEGPIWMMYHDINDMLFLKRTFLELASKGKENRICELFDTFEYSVLRKNIISSEVKFNNHATVGPLFRTYYFRLNDETKEWLLLRESVFDFRDDLQDLALYIDDKIVYSSCTHEQLETFFKVTKRKGELNKLAELKKSSKKSVKTEEKKRNKKTEKKR